MRGHEVLLQGSVVREGTPPAKRHDVWLEKFAAERSAPVGRHHEASSCVDPFAIFR